MPKHLSLVSSGDGDSVKLKPMNDSTLTEVTDSSGNVNVIDIDEEMKFFKALLKHKIISTNAGANVIDRKSENFWKR